MTVIISYPNSCEKRIEIEDNVVPVLTVHVFIHLQDIRGDQDHSQPQNCCLIISTSQDLLQSAPDIGRISIMLPSSALHSVCMEILAGHHHLVGADHGFQKDSYAIMTTRMIPKHVMHIRDAQNQDEKHQGMSNEPPYQHNMSFPPPLRNWIHPRHSLRN